MNESFKNEKPKTEFSLGFIKKQYTRGELDDIAFHHGGVVGMVGPEGLDPNMTIPKGWKLVVIGQKKETGAAGKVVLKPDDSETNKILREGRILLYIKSGLYPKEAELLDSADGSKVRFKTELASRLAGVLKSKEQREAFLEHPAEFNNSDRYNFESLNAQKRKAWFNKFRGVFGPEGTGLSFEREVMLARMVKAVLQKEK